MPHLIEKTLKPEYKLFLQKTLRKLDNNKKYLNILDIVY